MNAMDLKSFLFLIELILRPLQPPHTLLSCKISLSKQSDFVFMCHLGLVLMNNYCLYIRHNLENKAEYTVGI